jgi:hypothetical protein
MQPYLTAASGEELIAKLKADVLAMKAAASDSEWYERYHWGAFAAVAAECNLFLYPIQFFHTTNLNPDFHLSMPAEEIGIEVSRIATEPLLRSKALHRGTGRCHSLTPFVVDAPRLTNDEIMIKADIFANTEDQRQTSTTLDSFWTRTTSETIARKIKRRRAADYNDYGKNWLLLIDCLSVHGEFSRRANELAGDVVSRWSNKPTFDAIIFGDEDLRDFAILENGGAPRFMRAQHQFPF